jgi:hypothetical protein
MQRLPQLEFDGGSVDGRLWEFELQALHEVNDDGGDGEVAIPLVVGGDDEPRGMLAAGGREDVVVGVHVARPELALVNVSVGQLPVFFLVVDAGLEATGLFVARDVEIELEDEDVVVGEKALELVNVFEAAVGNIAGDELVDARREDVLVVRAVEDADHSTRWHLGVGAPEKVVAGFEWGGHLEGSDIAALGINSREDVADGAVLACGVHALEDDEQGLGLAGIKDFLQISQLRAVCGEDRFGSVLGPEGAGVGGRDFRQPYFGVRLDEMWRLEFHEATRDESRLG